MTVIAYVYNWSFCTVFRSYTYGLYEVPRSENKGEVLLSCQTSGRKVVSYRLLHRKYVFNKLRLECKIYIGYVNSQRQSWAFRFVGFRI
jgi:hypothetical protein